MNFTISKVGSSWCLNGMYSKWNWLQNHIASHDNALIDYKGWKIALGSDDWEVSYTVIHKGWHEFPTLRKAVNFIDGIAGE